MQNEQLIDRLLTNSTLKRLSALKQLKQNGELDVTAVDKNLNINYFFKTRYSCFDRTPSLVCYYAHKFGLPLATVVDYATLKGAEELIKAEKISNGLYYTGTEVSVSDKDGNKLTAFALGVPHKNIKNFDAELEKYRLLKLDYDNAYLQKLNNRFKKYGLTIDTKRRKLFESPKVTSVENLYYQLAKSILKKYSTADAINAFLTEELKFNLTERNLIDLSDVNANLYLTDLSAILMKELKIKTPEEKRYFIKDFSMLCEKYGAITAVLYNGDKTDKFFASVKKFGVDAVVVDFNSYNEDFLRTFYTESINENLMPICMTVIDMPRKLPLYKFTDTELANLYNTTAIAVVGHEISASVEVSDGMFTKQSVSNAPSLSDRIKLYYSIGTKGRKIK